MEMYNDKYDALINQIVDNIIVSLEESIYLPQSFHCVYDIDTNALRKDLYQYIYDNSLR